MKTTAFRLSAFLLAALFAAALFLLLLFLGDRSKGPLENILYSISTGISNVETKLMGGRTGEKRSQSLIWLKDYKMNYELLHKPDRILLGAYDNHSQQSFQGIIRLEDSLQVKFPLMHIYTAWGSKREQQFPFLHAQAIHELGSIPVITWEPWLDDFDRTEFPVNADLENVNKGGMKRVAGGAYDRYLENWAMNVKKFRQPVFIRLGHEMNDPYRYPWGPQNNTPEDYIAAWRHVVSLFRKVGADNAIWLWSPHPAYTTFHDFYPGDDYVHWIGVTTLNYGTVAPWSQWWSFDEIFHNGYTHLSPYNKPIMITELGSLSVGGDRAKWYSEAFNNFSEKYPAVKSIMFFHNNSDNTTTFKYLDWSFVNDEKVLKALREAFKDSYWDKPQAEN